MTKHVVSFLLFAIAAFGIGAAASGTPDIKGMYGWQLEMQFIRLGEGPIGKPVLIACRPKLVKPSTDCLESGLFLTEKECLKASGPKYIDLYPKPPAGPNDWYGSVFQCVHAIEGTRT